jgi:predicted kinase
MIIVIFGLPGTGKSYLSQQLLKEWKANYLSTDEVRKEMNKHRYDEATKQLIYDHILEKVQTLSQNGSHVIIDGTLYEQSKRDLFIQLADKLGQKIHFIEMKTASDRTVYERLQKNRDFSDADMKIYQQIKSQFETFDKPHLVLWSDCEEVPEMIEKVKNYVHE